MSSVLNRLRRKRREAVQYRFTATVQRAYVYSDKIYQWQPHKLAISCDRGKQNRQKDGLPWHGTQMLEWTDQDRKETTITLYKAARRGLRLKEKWWTFFAENISEDGRRKRLATGEINLTDYLSDQPKTADVKVTLQPDAKQMLLIEIDILLSCQVVLGDCGASQVDVEQIASQSIQVPDGRPHASNATGVSDEKEQNCASANSATERKKTRNKAGSSKQKKTSDVAAFAQYELNLLNAEEYAMKKLKENLEDEILQTGKIGRIEDQERMMKDWCTIMQFRCVLLKRQDDLKVLSEDSDSEKRFEVMERELNMLHTIADWKKTDAVKVWEGILLEGLKKARGKKAQPSRESRFSVLRFFSNFGH